jgi:hypothetical protein
VSLPTHASISYLPLTMIFAIIYSAFISHEALLSIKRARAGSPDTDGDGKGKATTAVRPSKKPRGGEPNRASLPTNTSRLLHPRTQSGRSSVTLGSSRGSANREASEQQVRHREPTPFEYVSRAATPLQVEPPRDTSVDSALPPEKPPQSPSTHPLPRRVGGDTIQIRSTDGDHSENIPISKPVDSPIPHQSQSEHSVSDAFAECESLTDDMLTLLHAGIEKCRQRKSTAENLVHRYEGMLHRLSPSRPETVAIVEKCKIARETARKESDRCTRELDNLEAALKLAQGEEL